MNELKQLKNKRVIKTSFTEKDISFTLQDGKIIVYNAVGDCCSNSFIEDIDDLSVLQDCVFYEVVLSRGEQIYYDDDVVSKRSFYKFKTTKGYATLSFRNDSNGCYNGYLELEE